MKNDNLAVNLSSWLCSDSRYFPMKSRLFECPVLFLGFPYLPSLSVDCSLFCMIAVWSKLCLVMDSFFSSPHPPHIFSLIFFSFHSLHFSHCLSLSYLFNFSLFLLVCYLFPSLSSSLSLSSHNIISNRHQHYTEEKVVQYSCCSLSSFTFTHF